MRSLRVIVLGLGLLAAACWHGCASVEPAPGDIRSACAAAHSRRLVPRTVELLEELAGLHLGREQNSARMESAASGDYRGCTAENDPRFNWMLNAELCSLMVLTSKPGATLEKQLEPVVREMLTLEQRILWSKFASLRTRPADDAERRECVLALELTTGWDKERIEGFDFASLDVPRDVPCGTDAAAANLSSAMRTAAGLLLASRSGNAAPPQLRGQLRELDTGRNVLARHYLREAEAAHAAAPTDDTLARWRIAAARCVFENAIPACMGSADWDLD